jgi:hypothetical protein
MRGESAEIPALFAKTLPLVTDGFDLTAPMPG